MKTNTKQTGNWQYICVGRLPLFCVPGKHIHWSKDQEECQNDPHLDEHNLECQNLQHPAQKLHVEFTYGLYSSHFLGSFSFSQEQCKCEIDIWV